MKMVVIFILLLLQPLLGDHQYKKTVAVCTDAKCINCYGGKTTTVSSCTESCIKPLTSVYQGTFCEEIPHGTACCDPHFTTWDKLRFSFHGECDLVLFSDPEFASGAGMVIQIRTKILQHYSYIKNLAMKIGEQYFEIEERNGPGVTFYYNGDAYEQPLTTFAGYRVRKVENATWCKDKCTEAAIQNFDFREFGSVEVGNWAGFLHVQVSIRPSNDSAGLLGKYGEIGFVARNGTILENANLYGQEWQVLDTEPMLFHEQRQPQYPEQCIMPRTNSFRRVTSETRRMAERVCSHLSGSLFDMCMFDVEATGDERMSISPMYI